MTTIIERDDEEGIEVRRDDEWVNGEGRNVSICAVTKYGADGWCQSSERVSIGSDILPAVIAAMLKAAEPEQP